MREPRPWQVNCRELYFRENRKEFLIVGTPGCGKTECALRIAKDLLEETVSKLVIVVPTQTLKEQWKDDGADLGIQIQPQWSNADMGWGESAIPTEFDGIAITYQQLTDGDELLRGICSRSRVLVILDEIHHCGDKKDWGKSAKYAFTPATKVLGLSGTPFRSDNNAIPFVRYIDGVGQADYSYGYSEAIADLVCRPVYFPKFDGRMEWENYGRKWVATFNDELPERQRAERLRAALSYRGEWLREVIKQADAKLSELRSGDENTQADTNAAGMVIASDITHAEKIMGLFYELGIGPVLCVTSDENQKVARDTIARFTSDSTPWIVSVKMVSEGVDIPRLRVGVYATPFTTELFFRQAVGRFVRYEGSDEESAYFYIPDDPMLRDYALTIREERDHVLDDEDVSEEGIGEEDGASKGTSGFNVISSEAIPAGTIFDADSITAQELDSAVRAQKEIPALKRFRLEELALLLRLMPGNRSAITGCHSMPKEEPLSDRILTLKRQNNAKVSQISYKWGLKFDDVNNALNKAVGIKSIRATNCTEQKLKTRLDLAKGWHRNGIIPSGA